VPSRAGQGSERSEHRAARAPAVQIYAVTDGAALKSRLFAGHDPGAIAEMARALIKAIDATGLVPVFVLRGGLHFWQPWRELVGPGPVGIVLPVRQQHDELPRITYASIPRVPDARYAVVDLVVASGRTIGASIDAIRCHSAGGSVDVVAPLISRTARDWLIAEFPAATIHCLWDAEAVDATGWLIGPNIDMGDSALGWLGAYDTWTGVA
jgi:uracil phosphoribosyltransferase